MRRTFLAILFAVPLLSSCGHSETMAEKVEAAQSTADEAHSKVEELETKVDDLEREVNDLKERVHMD